MLSSILTVMLAGFLVGCFLVTLVGCFIFVPVVMGLIMVKVIDWFNQ